MDHEGIAGFRALGYLARPPAPVGGTVATRDTSRHAANALAEAGGRPLQVVSPDGTEQGHLVMDDLLVARLHDLNEDTLRHQTLRCLSPLPGLLTARAT